MEWRHSLAPGSARRAPGAGGRKDLVWERGKAARESGLVTSLSEQAQKQRRTRGGARVSDPGESHPGRRGCPGSSRGSWSSWGSFAASQEGSCNCLRAWGGSGGARLPLAGERNSGRFAHGAAWTPSSGPRARGCYLEMSLWDLDLSPVTNLGDPTRLIAELPGGSLTAGLSTARLSGLRGRHCSRVPLRADCSWSRRWAAAVCKAAPAAEWAALPEPPGPDPRLR